MNSEPGSPLVDLSVSMEATAGTVWGILTSPALFSEWMGGQVDFAPESGSPFRAAFPHVQTVIAGTVLEVDPDRRHLALTWGLEEGPQSESFPTGCSRVDWWITEEGKGCRIRLTHSQVPESAMEHDHEGGWRFQLSRLSLYANRASLAAGFAKTLVAWFDAWAETDEEARLGLLRSACAEDVVFQDDWAVAADLETLSLHIGNCFRYMPGWKLEATGEVRICRGEALVGWRGVGPDGATSEGFNHVLADPDGLIRRVVGFQAG